MKNIVNKVRNFKFRNKLIFCTLLEGLIPLLIFSMVVGSIVVGEIKEKSAQLTLRMVNQTSQSLDVYIGTIEKLMNYIIDEGREVDTDNEEQTQKLQEMITSILRAYPEIRGIAIVYPDDSYIGKGMSRISRDLFADEYWYQYAIEQNEQLGVVGNALGRNVVSNLNDSSDSIFSLVKSFKIGGDTDDYGVVLFDIRHDIIEQLIDRVSMGEEGILYIVDDTDIVYTPVSDVVYRIDKKCYQKEGTNGETIRIHKNDYFVVNHYSSYSGWRIVGVIPETEFSSGIQVIYKMLVICIVICMILVVGVSVKISDNVTRPILELCKAMAKAESGDFSVRFETKNTDEIGILGQSFNHMIQKINGLMSELHTEKQKRLEAQLKSLQEQIKPHFLYNTLDTISWMARANNAMDVVKLLDALTNMFRIGLSSGRDYITLREEKKHVVNYLYIQKVRYGERLKYLIEVPEKYDNIIVPKLILQPLVENAIYHGVKLKRTSGNIIISAKSEGEKLYISVRDDGAGMSLQRLKEIREWLENPKERGEKIGFGLSYIQERIELSYGMDYGISIDSQEGEFTEVTICLPLQ